MGFFKGRWRFSESNKYILCLSKPLHGGGESNDLGLCEGGFIALHFSGDLKHLCWSY